jgi:hypothetical protein
MTVTVLAQPTGSLDSCCEPATHGKKAKLELTIMVLDVLAFHS